MELSAEQAAEYFRRSFVSVDGLWFVKNEEERGFDYALEIDRRVWEVMPKIQARMIRGWLGEGNGPEALERCLAVRYELEGYDASVERNQDGSVEARINGCPWLEKMRKSGRTHLSARVAEVICPTEHRAWAAEFGMAPEVCMSQSMCAGDGACGFVFRATPPDVAG